MNLEHINNVYLIGIGGIGMSALARYFNAQGYYVAGYDRLQTQLTLQLENEGIEIGYTDDFLPNLLDHNLEKTLVIFTPAVDQEHPQLVYFRDKSHSLFKRAEVLGMIAKDKLSVAVAGTHGKTTTTAIIAHLLDQSRGCTAFLGGLNAQSKSNFILDNKSDIVVIEADEYDRSFLHLNPDIAIITNIDQDHLDIYKNQQNIFDAFQQFVNNIKPGGLAIVHHTVKQYLTIPDSVICLDYGLDSSAQFLAKNVVANELIQSFDVFDNSNTLESIRYELPMLGLHNVENTLAALLCCQHLKVSNELLKDVLRSFSGIHRRFEVHNNNENGIFIDDYAHHPKEVSSTLKSVKSIFPQIELSVIFQPHLYSRTKDFSKEFAQALSISDEVFLLDIYPARELPIEGVSSGLIFEALECPKKSMITKEEVLEVISKDKRNLLLTMGAGDIDSLVPKLKTIYQS